MLFLFVKKKFICELRDTKVLRGKRGAHWSVVNNAVLNNLT
jgi:hypothetical protein